MPFAKAMDAADYRPSKRAGKVHQGARTQTCGDKWMIRLSLQLTADQCFSAAVHWFLSRMCSVYRVRFELFPSRANRQ